MKSQEETSKVKLKIEDFEIMQELGEGAFGKVNLVRRILNGKLYAIKTINK